MIRYPKIIEKGDTWGITATSAGIDTAYDEKRLAEAMKNLEKLGYKCIMTNNVKTNQKFSSSSGKIRAKEFMELWKNPNIKLIAQVKGGEFLMEMLPYFSKEVFLNNEPKWVTGYSDASLLNFYLTTNYFIATATTANILHYSMYPLDSSLINQLEILEGKITTQESYKFCEDLKSLREVSLATKPYTLTKRVCYKNLYNDKSEKISGCLIGGCLEALATIIGTKYDKTLEFTQNVSEGILWYLEVYDANPLDVYRILWQMKEANWFNKAKGFLIGRTRAIKTIGDFTYLDDLHKVFDDLKVPVIYDIDVGHVMPTWTMVNGSKATFTYKDGEGFLEYNLKDIDNKNLKLEVNDEI